MSINIQTPTGVTASGSTTTAWSNLLVRQSVLDSTNATYVRNWQLNNGVLVLTKGTNIAGIPLTQIAPLLFALVPQLSWPPNIGTQPSNASVIHPAPANFSVVITLIELPVTGYQWQVSTNGGTSWTNLTNGGAYSNVTTATMTVTPPDTSYDQYQFRCNITNASGTSTSKSAILTVT